MMAQGGFQISDLLDRLLAKGIVIQGQVLISVAGVDLVYLDLRLLLSSVETAMKPIAASMQGIDHGRL